MLLAGKADLLSQETCQCDPGERRLYSLNACRIMQHWGPCSAAT